GAATPDRVRCIDLAGLSPYQFVVVMHSAMKSDPAGLPKILCHDTAQLIAIPADGMRTGGKLDMGLVTGISLFKYQVFQRQPVQFCTLVHTERYGLAGGSAIGFIPACRPRRAQDGVGAFM